MGTDLRYNSFTHSLGGVIMSPLFQKKIDPRCAYCVHGRTLTEDQVACPKKGVMSVTSHCRAFQYDPLRRTPPRPAKVEFSSLKDEDFSL